MLMILTLSGNYIIELYLISYWSQTYFQVQYCSFLFKTKRVPFCLLVLCNSRSLLHNQCNTGNDGGKPTFMRIKSYNINAQWDCLLAKVLSQHVCSIISSFLKIPCDSLHEECWTFLSIMVKVTFLSPKG